MKVMRHVIHFRNGPDLDITDASEFRIRELLTFWTGQLDDADDEDHKNTIHQNISTCNAALQSR